jgi:cysteinyl-tRNA synthetase
MNKPNTTFHFYNTLSRSVVEFIPREANKVSIYCCGPTVYDYQHIGNFRTFIFEDILVRSLRAAGYTVRHVMNITDVGHLVGDGDNGEDKMLVAAKREKKKSLDIAKYYTDKFFEDWDTLKLVRPDIVCKATDHIQEMIALIGRIEKAGFAYVEGGNVYFDVSKFKEYGKLANLDLSKLQAGAATDIDAKKRSPFDFVLWFTRSKFENQELQWDSPWGRGYPGWHIECSAMSIKYLGEQFDIHCGGIDHIPVHHTNEIAQSEAAIGKPWVKTWLHGEFLVVDGEKMSKSKQNFYTINAFTERGFDPISFRYLCLSSHYKAHMNFTWEAVGNAASSLQRLKRLVLALKAKAGHLKAEPIPHSSELWQEFESAITDDLNMPKALSVIWKVAQDNSLPEKERLNYLYSFDDVAGFGISEWQESSESIPDDIAALVVQRDSARKTKNWPESDRLRSLLQEKGFTVEDTPQGTKVGR